MSEINMALLNDFIDEAREHLDEMESLLLQLGGDYENLDILNNIFRTMHNIKGGAQLTGLDKISTLSHRLEDLLDLLRNGEMIANNAMVETLISGRDRIVQLVTELEADQEEVSDVDNLVSELAGWIEGKTESDPLPTEVPEKGITAETEIAAPVEPAAPAEPETTPLASENNLQDPAASGYQEEYDQELFGIFVSHLKVQLEHLLSEIAHLTAGNNQAEYLQHCRDIIFNMRASANYMGYEELVALYDNCHASLQQFINLAIAGETVPSVCMDEYIDELVELFPQLDSVRQNASLLASEASEASEVTDDVADADIDDDDITASVMAAFGGNDDDIIDQPTEEAVPAPSTTIANVALFEDFIEEARQYLDEMEGLLIKLGNEPDNTELLNEIFRTIHNIKGGAQLTGLDKVSRLALRFEDLLDLLRTGKKVSTLSLVDNMIGVRDRIVILVNELEESQAEISPVDDIIAVLTAIIDSKESEESVATASSEDSTLLTSSRYAEENDKELFGIFIEHLKEQLAYIAAETNILSQAPVEMSRVVGCGDAVKRLWSSANYMGYEELTGFYDKWNSVLDQVGEVVAKGETVSLDFMDHYLGELASIFPQVGDVNALASQYTPANTAEPDMPDLPETQGKAEEKISATSLKQPEQVDDLFNKLNTALEASMKKVSDSELDTLHSVYDELVPADKNVPVAKAPTPQTQEVTAPNPVARKSKDSKKKSSGKSEQKQDEQKAKAQPDKSAAKTGENKIRKSVRVDAEKIDSLMNQVGELVVDRSYFFQLFSEMRDLQQYLKETAGVDQKEVKMLRTFYYRLGEAISALGRTSNDLQESVMKMRMLPISHIFNRYPRLVHDLTRNIDKNVKLEVYGEDTELDKMIVEELSDPLIHIIRNAIDHGLESVDERIRNGKPESGKLILDAYQESNHIVIEVTDDGRGISMERVKAKAISKDMYTPEELDRMGERDLTQLIMAPGFSTAEKITGTSGRGVGMDVVKKNIEKLNGTLEIDTKEGIGTQMRMKIPLTLAIIHALMIRVGKDMFTIPLANVDETVRISQADTSVVEGVDVIHLRGVALPIFHLSSVFNVKSDTNLDKSFVVIVSTDGKRTGFVVDELLGQEEVVIKPLADYVQERSGFSGATIIGDGRISLILDVYELVKMTASRLAAKHRAQTNKLKSGITGGHKKYDSGDGDGAPSTVH